MSHAGARWTFSNITHLPDHNSEDATNKSTCSENTERATYLPDLTAVLMSLSALLKPSAEPVNSGKAQSFNYNSLTKLEMFLVIASIPIEMEVICLFSSAARSLTRPLAS